MGSLEKLKIKLKVSEDMARKIQVDKETFQSEIEKLSLAWKIRRKRRL